MLSPLRPLLVVKSVFRSKGARRRRFVVPALEVLERRDVLSVSSLFFSGSTLVVRSDAAGSNVEVSATLAGVEVRDLGANQSWSYAAAQVGYVEFQGGAGSDRFVNGVAALGCRAFGFGGNDYLEGYDAADALIGGTGDDELVGYGGNDVLYGQEDGDVLLGMAGNDLLFAGDGNDRLNGGAGFDRLWAGNGDDVLITIDSGVTDLTQGEAGRDTYWADRIGIASDGVCGLYADDKLQHVASFANGADRTLDWDRIADPTPLSGHTFKRFAGNPLFGSAGPLMSDVRQGGLGDCYFLAGLAAIAGDNPQAIRQNVADFDDGTFGVRLGNSFYRVDDDLPVYTASSATPAYAKLGPQSSMWVAVYEKAFAHYRYGSNSYGSIEGGWSIEVNRAFGSVSAGARSLTGYLSATEIANDLYNRWSSGQAVTIGFLRERTTGAGTAPLIMGHMYTVAQVVRNGSGVVTSIVLRNPWGVDGTGSDADPSDGLVTVSAAQLLQYTGQVNWGRV